MSGSGRMDGISFEPKLRHRAMFQPGTQSFYAVRSDAVACMIRKVKVVCANNLCPPVRRAATLDNCPKAPLKSFIGTRGI